MKEYELKGLTAAEAGAGTGKTTFLVGEYIKRIKYQKSRGLDTASAVRSVLAVTFSRKAASEMLERARASLAEESAEPYFQIYTIDSFCARVLRSYPMFSGIDGGFGIVSEGNEKLFFSDMLARARNNLPLKVISPRDIGAEKPLYDFITKMRYDLITPDDLKKARSADGGGFAGYAGEVYSSFVSALKDSALLDFPQLLMETSLLLNDENVCRKLREEYRFVFIDEFQDTSRIQLEIFRKIKPQYLCVVGDYNQSIYSFRGAEPGNITRVTAEAAYRKPLVKNYRSTSRILEFVNTIGVNLKDYRALVPRDGAPEGEKVKIVVAPSRPAEASYIADRIKDIREKDGLKFSDFAVILRSFRSSVSDYERAFRAEGIPYLTSSGSGFYDRPEIRQLNAIVRAVAFPGDDSAFLALLVSPMFSFSQEEIYAFASVRGCDVSLYDAFVAYCPEGAKKSLVSDLFERIFSLNHSSLYRFMHNLVLVSGIVNWVRANFKGVYLDRALANIKKFLEVVLNYDSGPGTVSLSSFAGCIGEITEQGAVESDADVGPGDCVDIMTVHSIKGLEKKVVFVANIKPRQFPGPNRQDTPWKFEDGIISRPEKKKKKADVPDEEWRLFYVALTRAKEKLFLLGCRSGDKLSPMLTYFLDDEPEKPALRKEFVRLAELEFAAPAKSGESFKPGTAVPFVEYRQPPEFFSEEAASREKLERGLTVTEMVLYDSCPQRFRFERILKNAAGGSTAALKTGNVFHQSIEYFSELGEKNFKGRIYESLGNSGAGRGRVKTLIDNFLRSRFTSKPLMAEEPFVLNIEGVFVKGTIDRIDRDRGGYALCDYKTGGSSGGYGFQMNMYVLGCEDVLGLSPVKKLTLFFLKDGSEKEVAINDRASVVRKMESIIEGIRKMEFRAVSGEACGVCPYKDICV